MEREQGVRVVWAKDAKTAVIYVHSELPGTDWIGGKQLVGEIVIDGQ